MSEKTLKLDNAEINERELDASKQAIDLNLVDIDKIVISDKLKLSDNDSKYFIGYKKDNIIRSLCIVLSQMSGYIKYFDVVERICLLKLKVIMYWLNMMKFGTKLK